MKTNSINGICLFDVVGLGIIAAAVAVGCGSEGGQAPSSSDPATSESSPSASQERVAQTTLALEKAFSDQFVKGQIDRQVLAPLVRDVVQAMPEADQPKVQEHIDAIMLRGEQRAPRMTSEQRAQLAAPPADRSKVHVDWVTAYGWPGCAGFGGYGAFGFPYYGYGLGYGLGYGAFGYGIGYGVGYGVGFGCGTAAFGCF